MENHVETMYRLINIWRSVLRSATSLADGKSNCALNLGKVPAHAYLNQNSIGRPNVSNGHDRL
jgi:hypothetical protein